MVSQVLTANRLIDGDVVYWRAGQWVEALGEADVFSGPAEADAAVGLAKAFVARNVVVNPYLFEVRPGPDGVVPVKEREIIRAMGPSIHPNLGKQSRAETAPPKSLHRPPPGFAKATPGKPESADDVSI
jgi:sulfite reductase (NADPH) hemoprotein beta-component